ncbi:MAG: right-handed parallel beta-helix repeat-containing protein, partial [Clostridia bacterium]|nr:right-handed parallel beta-helix repeat-containing protein [Clostridia bacterium]
MKKRVFALLCAVVLMLSFETAAFAEVADRPSSELVPGERYVSDHLPSASALYVSGRQVTLDDAYFYGAGYASDKEITAQIPNQYGICSVVLAAGQETDVTLNNPTIVSDPESYANGVFSAAMAKITVNGGTIDTDNSSGHGVDATYMGRVYIYDTVIHTRGETSGALATDFGGGFITGERLDCATEGGSSPGIFCAGSTIIMLKDSRLTTTKATGVVVAHDHAAVVLAGCVVDAEGTAVSGLQALPNAASSDGSVFYAFGGKLLSRTGAVVGESGGRTVVNLIGAECAAGGETAISCRS